MVIKMEDKKNIIKGYLIGQTLNIVMDNPKDIYALQNDETLIILKANTANSDGINLEVE
jgi:hypothetical protein